jgi:hypothetical protein
MKKPCAPKIQGQPPCWITSSAVYPKISRPITLHISVPNSLTCLDLYLQEGRAGIAWKKSSLIYSAPSLNKHLFSHFVSYLFLLFSQSQISKCYRTLCCLVPALTAAVYFPLSTIYVYDTNCSSVPFILVIDFDFFPSILWSLVWSIWYTIAIFYPVQLISFLVFLISDIVNEIPTRPIVIKIYFHFCTHFLVPLCLFRQVKKAITSVSILLNVLFIFCIKNLL